MHIYCKKDHHKLQLDTVSEQISEEYENLLKFKLIFVKPSKVAKLQGIFVPIDAQDIRLENAPEDESKCQINFLLQNDNKAGFSLRHRDKETFHEDAEILLTIPSFSLFITGDLSFYADVLGMPNSSS